MVAAAEQKAHWKNQFKGAVVGSNWPQKKRASHLCGKKHPKSRKSHTLATSPLKPIPNINGNPFILLEMGDAWVWLNHPSSTNVHTCPQKYGRWACFSHTNPPKKKNLLRKKKDFWGTRKNSLLIALLKLTKKKVFPQAWKKWVY